jgi:hypothetical protein
MWQPVNDLERAYRDAHLGLEETVEYFRQLSESILLFLMPLPPDGKQILQLGNGDSMALTLWNVQGEDMVPIFTSTDRVEEALQAAGKWHERNGVGEMLGKELLHVISMQPKPHRIVVNPGCQSGWRTMDRKMVEAILDGSAMFIPTQGERDLNGLVLSLPVRLPDKIKQPLCKYFATRPEIKAAWLFYEEKPAQPFEQVYAVGVMVEGGDAREVLRETTLAIAGACPPEWGSRAFLMDPKDPGSTETMAALPPFYSVPGFQKIKWPPEKAG